jgi:NitT/TauT family transport system substrate-binding protein
MKRRPSAILFGIILLCIGAILWKCRPAKNADFGTFRVAYGRTIDDLPFFVGIDEGFFKEEGLIVDQVLIGNSTEALAALFKNEIQGCELSFSEVVYATQKKLPIKIVTWMGRAHSRTRCGFHVRQNSDIRTIADLKNRKIALGNAVSSRIITFTLLKKAGLKPEEVNLIYGLELNDPMKLEAALKSGRVDLILC